MPELPEIETIKLGLRKNLIGHTITDVKVNIPKMFIGKKEDVLGAKVTNLQRIGKGLIIELNNGYLLVVHLKMTGQLVFRDAKNNKPLSLKVGGSSLPSKYTHIIFTLDPSAGSGQVAMLYYNDLRQFGWVKVLKKDELMQMPFFREMGPEPKVAEDLAGKELTFPYFKETVLKVKDYRIPLVGV